MYDDKIDELNNRLDFAHERIAILEQLVQGLATKAGAHQPYLNQWTVAVANWPDIPEPITVAARHVTEWGRGLKK